jgi:hypothetical protein
MGSKRNMIDDEIDNPDEIQANVHEERRKEKKKNFK